MAAGLRSRIQPFGLMLVVFVAVFVILLGVAAGTGLIGAKSVPGATTSPSPVVTASPPGSTQSPSASTSPSPSPTPTEPPPAVLVGAGDIALCSTDADEATAALLDGIPGTVFTAGDNAYGSGTAEQFADCYGPSWGRHLDRTLPSAGNHDHLTKDLAGYFGYFGSRAGAAGQSWYSTDLGAWHVIVLDSECDKVGGCGLDRPQGKWLVQDLAASTARCTVAIWHHPRFSSGFHGNDADVDPFWRALYAAGVDVVLNGHDHDYERFAPQDPDANPTPDGIRQFVVGTGGAALRNFEKTAANSLVRSAIAHGVIKLTLHQAAYDWEFISVDGSFTDAGSATCH